MSLEELKQLQEMLEKYIKYAETTMCLEAVIPLHRLLKEHIDLKENGY